MLNVISGILSGGAAPDLGAYEAISTVAVGSGGASSVSFSSIPSTYKHLQIRGIWKPSTGAELLGGYNGDTTTSHYWRHYLQGDGSSASAGGQNSWDFLGYNTGTGYFTATTIDILDYANTNKYKVSRCLWGNDTNGGGYIGLVSGNWSNTAAINAIALTLTGGSFVQYSSFALYGIKG